MRWFVDISSIGSSDAKARFCVEAEQWQKALQVVRAKRGDDGPFGHFSIELLDDGFRAIDPLTRTRYVVQRAPDDAPLIADGVPPEDELTNVGGRPPGAIRAPSPAPSKPRSSGRGTARASDRGRISRSKAPSIPDDPVPRGASEAAKPSAAGAQSAPPVASPPVSAPPVSAPPAAASSPAAPAPSTPPKSIGDTTLASSGANGAPAAGSSGASSSSAPRPASERPSQAPQRRSEVPLVAPKPMQAETAFERMTGGSAVSLPAQVSASAELQTEVLPPYKVLSRRSEDPTASSPLTYREMALSVATTTSLRDAEAIARSQFEVIRNAITGAPKGKFIQLAVFDHEFTGKPQKQPIVTLSFKDWRNAEPDLRFPLRDGAGPASTSRPPVAPSVPPAPAPPASPSSPAAPSTVEAPTVPILADTVVKTVVPTSMARPSIEPVTRPAGSADQAANTVPEPSLPAPSSPVPGSSEPDSDVIKPAPIIAVAGSPIAPETPAPPPADADADADAEPAPATVPSEPPPAPTSAQIRARAKDMAGDDEKTLVKPSNPPPAPSAPPPAPVANEHVVNKTTKMQAVQHPSAPPPAQHPSAPPPAQHPSAPPPAQHPSAPPPAQHPSAPPPAAAQARMPSVPPAPAIPVMPQGPPLLVRQPIGPRRSGDDLITDLFEACSDLAFLSDTLEGADFVLALVLDTIPSAVALCSFFDINTREMVVVRQAVNPSFAKLPNVLGTRASEFTPLIAKSMRAGHAIVVASADRGIFTEDARWRALTVTPESAISAPVVASGRYLGLIEVADPMDGAPFTETDGHALTYIGEQFSEYLAQREIDLSPERILRPKLTQMARR